MWERRFGVAGLITKVARPQTTIHHHTVYFVAVCRSRLGKTGPALTVTPFFGKVWRWIRALSLHNHHRQTHLKYSCTYLDATPNLPETAVMGKVHGSLARAGKVRSQTPKVRILRCNCLRYYLTYVLNMWDDVGWKTRKTQVPQGAGEEEESVCQPCQCTLNVEKLTMDSRYIRRFVNVTLTGGKRKVSPSIVIYELLPWY